MLERAGNADEVCLFSVVIKKNTLLQGSIGQSCPFPRQTSDCIVREVWKPRQWPSKNQQLPLSPAHFLFLCLRAQQCCDDLPGLCVTARQPDAFSFPHSDRKQHYCNGKLFLTSAAAVTGHKLTHAVWAFYKMCIVLLLIFCRIICEICLHI